MATWQFTIEFIPRDWAEDNMSNVQELYDSDGYNTQVAWKKSQPVIDFIAILSEILPLSESWHKDLLTWGDVKSHDIQVWHENQMVESITLRLDLQQNFNSLLINIVKAAIKLNCMFFIPEKKSIIEPNEFELKNAALNSQAAKFVKDPIEVLKNIE